MVKDYRFQQNALALARRELLEAAAIFGMGDPFNRERDTRVFLRAARYFAWLEREFHHSLPETEHVQLLLCSRRFYDTDPRGGLIADYWRTKLYCVAADMMHERLTLKFAAKYPSQN